MIAIIFVRILILFYKILTINILHKYITKYSLFLKCEMFINKLNNKKNNQGININIPEGDKNAIFKRFSFLRFLTTIWVVDEDFFNKWTVSPQELATMLYIPPRCLCFAIVIKWFSNSYVGIAYIIRA